MSHGLRVADDGRVTFVAVDEGAWHGLVTPVKGPLAATAALEMGHMKGLDYHTEPLLAVMTDPAIFVPVPDKYTTVARDPFDRSRWESIGGYLSDGYTMHTPEDIAEFGDALAGQGATLSAIGLIDEGKRMFASFKVRDYQFGGDQMFAWLNVYSDFTGGAATVCKPGATRVVCKNTFHIGLAEQVAIKFKARHTGVGLVDRVDEARQALGIAEQAMDHFEAQVQRMLDTELSDAKFAKIVEQYMPIPEDALPRIVLKREQARDAITSVWKSGNAAGISGTAWGAYNSLTEYIDWTGGSYRSDEARFAAALTPGSQMDKERDRALALVRAVL